ncbi:XRE family transcriptional regulator [Streptomyces sp. CC208A]|uniref:helix-turn-helix domain-containing protein n=1 Tax=Streptomyces sp. CC208A TaxID=3044573 RepID=UPI0024A9B881|nr:XRE family transcriptional regulator [Streptomyces sp. CC208A]
MPAWKSLSDELDPEVRAFTERLRTVVDRSGLGVGAVAERTGHEPAAWGAYLDARLPVPRDAVVALADVTGADLGPLAAQWEHADRAWKRASGAPAAAAVAPGVPEDVPAERTMRIRKVVPPDPAPGPALTSTPRPPRRASPLLYAAGLVGAALVVTAAVLLADLGGSGATPPAAAPTAPPITVAPTPSLPEGVRCTGADCEGRDPEAMGCGGPHAVTVARTYLGTALVEVRHSAVCAAAWARISGATAGDEVTVQAGTAVQLAHVLEEGATGAYTPMVAAGPGSSGVRACANRSNGSDGCTDG